ncbi:MAG: Signal peptidase-like protein [Gemmatimonadota bacterium]|nr:Signal peptidase-like protein [Gemmatimonadota bacterium]
MAVIEVAFRGNRKEFFGWENGEPPALLTPVIVEADRGEDLGTVHAIGELAAKRNSGCAHGCGEPVRKALRVATRRDIRQGDSLQRANEDARQRAADKVRAANLQMKISDAEWQWDKKKLTLYFTAEKRVDFRNLVRDLAAAFRTRIELKQIGVRDEAKRLDGVGRCGRQYCSAAWLPDLRPVNLGVAKDQRLSLNPSQISGACGRLMCCLRYEHDFYVETRKRFPKEGRIVTTLAGEEKIISVDLFRETVTLRNAEGAVRIIPLEAFGAEVEGRATPAVNAGDEEGEYTRDEISPELMYTSEFAIPEPRLVILTETVETEPALPSVQKPQRRRRGRRGGGGDSGASPDADPGGDTGGSHGGAAPPGGTAGPAGQGPAKGV